MLFGDFRQSLDHDLSYYQETLKREEAPLDVDTAFRYLRDALHQKLRELEASVYRTLGSGRDLE